MVENALKQIEIIETNNQLDEEISNSNNVNIMNGGNLSCGDSIDSLNSNSSNEITSNQDSPTKEENALSTSEEVELVNELKDLQVTQPLASSTLIKRSHLKSLIYEIYNLNESESNDESSKQPAGPQILVEGFMEKLPPRKNLKNSILLAWKKRYFKLSSIGLLHVFDFNEQNILSSEPIESYNLMGARVIYEQNEVISLDDNRGSCVVFRCCESPDLTSDQVRNFFLF